MQRARQSHALPKPGASVDEDAAGWNAGKRADRIDKVFAPGCDVLCRVHGRIRRCYFYVENHDFASRELANGVDKVLCLRPGILARMAKVVSASEMKG